MNWTSTVSVPGGTTTYSAYAATVTTLNYEQSAPYPSGGQTKSIRSDDGSGTDYTYDLGTYDPQARRFNPGDGAAVRTVTHQFAPNTTATWRTLITDENGKDVLRETYYAPPGPAVLATRRASVYDTQGNLTDTYLEVIGGWRRTSHLEWDENTGTGHKLREVDETGIETVYSYPSVGVEVATRSAVPAAGVLPAIPALTTTSTYDVEGRLTRQVMTDGNATQVHTWGGKGVSGWKRGQGAICDSGDLREGSEG